MSSLFQRCQFCRKQLDSSKIVLHELYCERNCVKCERCGFMYDQTDQESHDEEFHKMQTCPHCKNEFQDLTQHHCNKQPIRCQYCQLDYALDIYEEHQIQCGSRTERCHICQQYIILRNMEKHILTCSKDKNKDDFPTIQEVENKNRRNQELQQQKKVENQNKIPQKDSKYSREPIQQQIKNDQNNDRKRDNDQNLKKEIIPQEWKYEQLGQKQFQEQQVFQTQQNKINGREKIFQTSNDQQTKISEDKRNTKLNQPNKVAYNDAQSPSNNFIMKPGILDKQPESGKFVKEYESFKSQDQNLDQYTYQQKQQQQQHLQQYQQYQQQQQQQKQQQQQLQNGVSDLPLKNYKDTKATNYPNQYDDKSSQQLNKYDRKDPFKSSNIEKNDNRDQRKTNSSNQNLKFNNQPQIPIAQKESIAQSNYIYGQNFPAQNQINQQIPPQNYIQDIPIQKQGSQNSYLQKYEQPRNQQKNQTNYEYPEQNQQYFKELVPSTNQVQYQFQQKQTTNGKQQPIETNQQIQKSTYQTKEQPKNIQRNAGSSIVKPDYKNEIYKQKELEDQNKNYFQQSYPESTILYNQPSQYRVPKNPNAYQETKFIKMQDLENNFQPPPQEELPLPNDSMIARKLQEEFDLGMTQSTIQEQTRQFQEFESKKQAIPANKPSMYDELKYQKKPKSPPPQRNNKTPQRQLSPPKNIAFEDEFNYLGEDERNLQLALIEAYEREKLYRRA